MIAATLSQIPSRLRRLREKNGRVIVQLSRNQDEPKAFKLTIPANETDPFLRTHAGHEWLYVLSDSLRLILGDYDLILGPGEAAEFDTRHPHWFGASGRGSVEVLSLFGKQGERIHVRARSAVARTRDDVGEGGRLQPMVAVPKCG